MVDKLLILLKNVLVEILVVIAILARKEKEIVTITTIVLEILCVGRTIANQDH